jgi:PEP-CTERM motif-containing protein
MKRIALLAILALALPLAAFANSIDTTNSGGTLTGSTGGMSLSGSVLIAVNGLNGLGLVTGNNLGSVSFTTGALTGGTLHMGGTFAAGGAFTIIGNGSSGIPNATIFSGSFSGPVTWTLVTLANGTHNYTLTGAVSGTLGSSFHTDGVTLQLTINTGRGFFNGSTTISSGDTSMSVPEPGTLGLLGTGLVGIAGAMHRKFKR